MGASDGSYSYVHFTDPNQVLYMENWANDDPIPFDDLDTQGLFEATGTLFPQFLLEEEEDGGIPINPATFSLKYYKNKKLLKDRVWNDLGIHDKFLNPDSDLNKQYDRTILKPLHHSHHDINMTDDLFHGHDELNIAQFLANGYGPSENIDNVLTSNDLVNDSIMGNNTSDLSINLNTDFIPPNFPVPKRNNSNGNINYMNGPTQTPRVGRPRQPSNDRNFQTPVTRILRRNFTE